MSGVGLGVVYASIYTSTALSLWWGTHLVRTQLENYLPGKTVIVSNASLPQRV